MMILFLMHYGKKQIEERFDNYSLLKKKQCLKNTLTVKKLVI